LQFVCGVVSTIVKLKGAAKAAFLRRMNKGRVAAGLKKIGSKTKSVIKRRSTKSKKNKTKSTKRPKSKSNNRKPVAKKNGTKGMTRVKKFILGVGVGALVSTIAAFAKQPAIESSGPIIDAAVGGGVEAQIGTAIPRLIRTFVFANGNGGGNGGGVGGA